jgi:hypothetical protein
VACPYFVPIAPHPRDLWPRRRNLPLGDGFLGRCAADPAGACDDEMLRSACNLGYANCARLPAEREFDAVRFVVRLESPAVARMQLCAEREHRPAYCCELRYDLSSGKWMHPPELRFKSLSCAAVTAFLDGTGSPFATNGPTDDSNQQ